jgi:hypothetical protein
MLASGVDFCVACHRSQATSKVPKDWVRQALAVDIPTFLIERTQSEIRARFERLDYRGRVMLARPPPLSWVVTDDHALLDD